MNPYEPSPIPRFPVRLLAGALVLTAAANEHLRQGRSAFAAAPSHQARRRDPLRGRARRLPDRDHLRTRHACARHASRPRKSSPPGNAPARTRSSFTSARAMKRPLPAEVSQLALPRGNYMPWRRMLACITGRRNAETRTLKRPASIYMAQALCHGSSMDQDTATGFGDTGGAAQSPVDEELLRNWRAEQLVSGGFARALSPSLRLQVHGHADMLCQGWTRGIYLRLIPYLAQPVLVRVLLVLVTP